MILQQISNKKSTHECERANSIYKKRVNTSRNEQTAYKARRGSPYCKERLLLQTKKIESLGIFITVRNKENNSSQVQAHLLCRVHYTLLFKQQGCIIWLVREYELWKILTIQVGTARKMGFSSGSEGNLYSALDSDLSKTWKWVGQAVMRALKTRLWILTDLNQT